MHNIVTRTTSNGTILTSNSSTPNVTNSYTANVHPSNQQQIPQHNQSTVPVLTIPSHVCSATTTNSQQTLAPTQNSIYLSIACGDEKTRHRFCLVVQMMCSLLQKNGQSANAINQFTERFKHLKEQADLSPQHEDTFLQALLSFGKITTCPENNQSNHPPQINQTDPANAISSVSQCINSAKSLNVTENVKTHKPCAAPSSRKRRSSARRVRCGSCEGCINHNRTRDCRACRNCLDQKRYGGPGKLKKACLKRLCLVLSSSNIAPATPLPTLQPLPPVPSSSIPTVSIPNNLPLDVPLPQHPMPISSLNGAVNPGKTMVGQIKRVELQVHHHRQQRPQNQQQQQGVQNQQHASTEQPNTLPTSVNNVEHVNNITSTMHRQQLDNNTMQINIAQGHNSQGMPIITMHQPINLGPQVLHT